MEVDVAGKIIYSYGPSFMAMLNNQRVTEMVFRVFSIFGVFSMIIVFTIAITTTIVSHYESVSVSLTMSLFFIAIFQLPKLLASCL